MIYLDAGATTLQKPPAVALAVQSAMCRMATPGRGGHPPAMRAADAVYDCRCLAGALFDAQPEQVVFTMNATHALNLAIKTLVKPGGRAVISGFEHNAVLRPLHHLGAEIIVAGGYDFRVRPRHHAGHKRRDLHARVQRVRVYPACRRNCGPVPCARRSVRARRVAVGGAAAHAPCGAWRGFYRYAGP